MSAPTERQRQISQGMRAWWKRRKRGKAMDVHSVLIAVDKADKADVWRLSITIDEQPPIVRYYDSETMAMENKKKAEKELSQFWVMRPMQKGGTA